jgi:aryl-alcohol dehydrogenase-like predicted oxidoreductase
MTTNRYVLLGLSGLCVSPTSLGTMTFGTELGWARMKPSRGNSSICAWMREAISLTSDVDTNGTSEILTGQFITEWSC